MGRRELIAAIHPDFVRVEPVSLKESAGQVPITATRLCAMTTLDLPGPGLTCLAITAYLPLQSLGVFI